MNDIVERLRKREMLAVIGKDRPDIYKDAADEIKRLREALNEQIASQQQLRGLIAQYSQRYVRMQEALKPFAYYAEQIPNDVGNTASASGTVGDLRAAKAALEGK